MSRQGTIFGLLNHLRFMPLHVILSLLAGVPMVTRKKTDIVQLSKVRIREALRRKLERDAKREKTTLNAQIVRRIEDSLREEERIEEWRKQAEHHLPEIVEHDSLQEHIDTEIADGIAKAKNRDSAIVDMMVANNNESAAFLRWIASELMQRPDWSKSAEGKQALSDRIRDRISKDQQNRKESQ